MSAVCWVSPAGNGTHFVAYDGNGNVTALTDSSGNISARYEYSPFGETVRASGSVAGLNQIRFSTKYTDSESGFCYYGYRFYNAGIGSWLSRDPSGEGGGGLNLYTFVFNSPLGWMDSNGLGPENWSARDYIMRDRPDPNGGWRAANGRFMTPPEPSGSLQQPIPPPPPRGIGIPNNQSVGSKKGDTSAGGLAGGLEAAANNWSVKLEQMQLNRFASEGYKSCLVQAKGIGCGGCCVLNLYAVRQN